MRVKTAKYSILYVDDEEVNLRVFKYAFRREYNVFTALSGAEALEIVKNDKVDVVITDQRMPTMTGVELLKIIADIDPSIIRIIMTGFSDIGALVEAVNDIGINKYLKKPWDKHQLKDTIDKELERYLHTQGISTAEDTQSESVDSKLANASSFIQNVVLKDTNEINDLFEKNILIRKSPFIATNDVYWIGKKGEKKVFILIDINTTGAISGLITTAIHGIISEVVYTNKDWTESRALDHKIRKVLEDKMILANLSKYSEMPLKSSIVVVDENEDVIDCCCDGDNIMLMGLNENTAISNSSRRETFSMIRKVFIHSDGFNEVLNQGSIPEDILITTSDQPIAHQGDLISGKLETWLKENTLNDSLTLIGFEA